MKFFPVMIPAIFLVLSSVAYAQSAQPPAERAAKPPPACDDLQGIDKEVCLKQGGTVKANSAGSGSSVPQRSEPTPANPSAERSAEPNAKKDYTKPDSK
jgi:hypothetical protein